MKVIIVLIFLIIILFQINPASAWYGAGYSNEWPNTTNGATGKVNSPIYNTPPEFYFENENITINFEIENPEGNTNSISNNLYLKLWKVENSNPEQSISEQTLYNSHQSGNDTQAPFKTINLGPLNLAPGDITNFSAEFNIENAGYYQFDLTSLSENQQFIPGKIYAAGFLRILPRNNTNSLVQSETGSFVNYVPLLLVLLALIVATFIKYKNKILALIKPRFSR